MARVVDLSHPIEHGMITLPGLPGPVISDFLGREASRGHYAGGTTFHIARVRMVANTGTYVDAPFHRYAEGKDVGSLPLESLADLDGVVVDAPSGGRAVDADRFEGRSLRGKAVLVRTGWDAHWRTPRYADGHPFLTRAAAESLAGAGPALVGIDSFNVDDASDGVRPAHTLLLAAGIPIVEHLRGLKALPETGFRFHAVPAPFRGMGSFPVRAYAVVA
ncbi:MAG TPA: cyclase family protein [Thermoanaerobaculia bacterium]|nr:cyclase family protein [Thermoanaerobaculia bacterium]